MMRWLFGSREKQTPSLNKWKKGVKELAIRSFNQYLRKRMKKGRKKILKKRKKKDNKGEKSEREENKREGNK